MKISEKSKEHNDAKDSVRESMKPESDAYSLWLQNYCVSQNPWESEEEYLARIEERRKDMKYLNDNFDSYVKKLKESK